MTAEQAAQHSGALVLIPVGSTEQHGAHLPLSVDWRVPEYLCRMVASTRRNVLVAEPLALGCSAHHMSFPGTVSLRVSTFIAMIVDIAVSLVQHSFIPVFVNGHGGNRAPLGAAVQQLLEQGHTAWAVTYFDTARAEIVETFGAGSVGHACALETSLMMAIDPRDVRSDQIPEVPQIEAYPDPSLFSSHSVTRHRRFEEFGASGVVGRPELFDAASGEMLLHLMAERLHEITARIQQDSANVRKREE